MIFYCGERDTELTAGSGLYHMYNFIVDAQTHT